MEGARAIDRSLERLPLRGGLLAMDIGSGICAIESHAIISSQACEDLRFLRRRGPRMSHMIEKHKTILDTLNSAQATFRSPSLDRREQERGPCGESGLQGGWRVVAEIMETVPGFQQRDNTSGCSIALLERECQIVLILKSVLPAN